MYQSVEQNIFVKHRPAYDVRHQKRQKPRYSARGVLNEYPDFCRPRDATRRSLCVRNLTQLPSAHRNVRARQNSLKFKRADLCSVWMSRHFRFWLVLNPLNRMHQWSNLMNRRLVYESILEFPDRGFRSIPALIHPSLALSLVEPRWFLFFGLSVWINGIGRHAPIPLKFKIAVFHFPP